MNALDIATALIHKWEGCSLVAYPDPVSGGDPWTIGYGATSPNIIQGTIWTQEQADDDLAARLNRLQGEIIWPLDASLNQIGSCMSLAYNIGVGAFLQSTLFAKWNSGDIQAAADQFVAWNKVGGKVIQGLVNRRADEQRVFCGGMP